VAAPNLPALSPFNFHSPLRSRLMAMVDRALAEAQLHECFWDDAYCSCREKATVHHLESEMDYCDRHYRLVEKGIFHED